MKRRQFLEGTLAAFAAGPALWGARLPGARTAETYWPNRRRLPNPYLENGKAVVVVVRGTDFPAMLAKGMASLGGFVKFGAGKPVLIKPNFVFDKISSYPTTTDDRSVLTLIDFLQKEGFRDITVADRRGKKANNGRAGGKFEWSGMNDMAAAGGFKTDSLMDNGVAESVAVKDARWTEMPAYSVIKRIYEAPLIINMPTLKRHTGTNLTCALKNMMGVLDVPTTDTMHLWGDGNKARHDAMTPADLNRRLCLTVAEAAAAVNPEVTVIDARTVLCRNHLDHQTGGPLQANRLIISGDPLAADVVAAQVMKDVDPAYDMGYTADTFVHAAKLGVGAADPAGFVLRTIDA